MCHLLWREQTTNHKLKTTNSFSRLPSSYLCPMQNPKRILAFSSSRTGKSGYLEIALPLIKEFLGEKKLTIAFIPFAAVDGDYETYANKVREALPAQYNIVTVTHHTAVDAINTADAIITGGGNTFKLLHDLYQTEAIAAIKQKVNSGTPYIGWSAGSNIAGYSICTTNDMPIIDPGSFTALHFLPFQINPHYYNITIPGFNGETRDQRLEEFLILNPNIPVVALPEGTALLLENEKLFLKGGDAFVLTYNNGALVKTAVGENSDLSYLSYNR
jgi:dipeptidase E